MCVRGVVRVPRAERFRQVDHDPHDDAGCRRRPAGRLEVLGYDPAAYPLEVKRRIGFMPEDLSSTND
jgi:hypothetical protein